MTGLQKRAAVLSARGPCVDRMEFGAGQDVMEEMGRASKACVLCISPCQSLPREALGSPSSPLLACDGIALVCIIADTKT